MSAQNNNNANQNTFNQTGIQIPENAENIEAFKNVRNVDAKQLNEKLAQEQALNTPGIQIPKNAESIDAFKKVSDVNAKELNDKLNE